MQSTIVVLFAILLHQALSIPIAPEIDDSEEELCQFSDSNNCTISFKRDVRRSLILIDTEEEETIQNPEFILTEGSLFSESLSQDETRENYEVVIDVHISENKESLSYSDSEEHNKRRSKIIHKRDSQNQGETVITYNEENNNDPNENSGYPENGDISSSNGETFENGYDAEKNYPENLPLPQTVGPMDETVTLDQDSDYETDIDLPVVDRMMKQTRHTKTAFPYYDEIESADDEEQLGNGLDILDDLGLMENEGFEDLEESIGILKEAESVLPKETDDMLYPRFSISEEAHFAKDSNITTIIGCGEGCNENVNMTDRGYETIVTEMRHEEIDLEIKILESDLGETTTQAVWNTEEFVDRTSKNLPFTKRDTEVEGNTKNEYSTTFKSITKNPMNYFISLDHIFRSNINES